MNLCLTNQHDIYVCHVVGETVHYRFACVVSPTGRKKSVLLQQFISHQQVSLSYSETSRSLLVFSYIFDSKGENRIDI